MRQRNNRISVRLNDDEFVNAKSRISKTGLSIEACLRSIINGFIPREKPDERFYLMMKELIEVMNTANQLARHVNRFDSDVAWMLYNELEKLSRLQLDIRQTFLLPEKL